MTALQAPVVVCDFPAVQIRTVSSHAEFLGSELSLLLLKKDSGAIVASKKLAVSELLNRDQSTPPVTELHLEGDGPTTLCGKLVFPRLPRYLQVRCTVPGAHPLFRGPHSRGGVMVVVPRPRWPMVCCTKTALSTTLLAALPSSCHECKAGIRVPLQHPSHRPSLPSSTPFLSLPACT